MSSSQQSLANVKGDVAKEEVQSLMDSAGGGDDSGAPPPGKLSPPRPCDVNVSFKRLFASIRSKNRFSIHSYCVVPAVSTYLDLDAWRREHPKAETVPTHVLIGIGRRQRKSGSGTEYLVPTILDIVIEGDVASLPRYDASWADVQDAAWAFHRCSNNGRWLSSWEEAVIGFDLMMEAAGWPITSNDLETKVLDLGRSVCKNGSHGQTCSCFA